MKIVIIGYGKMGKEIEEVSKLRNHEIVLKIDRDNLQDFESEEFKNSDIAIEFTNPKNAYQNFLKCFDKKIPVVSGTTGWFDKLENVKNIVKNKNLSFFYASNFSLGVNLFYKLNKEFAKLMNKHNQYEASILEKHHKHKLDAPSGTAINLLNDLIKVSSKKKNEIKVKSLREGEIFGIHKIIYTSLLDEIKISHELKSRKALATGAIIAAEFLFNKKGVFTMEDILNN
ncbi:MAG: 4-hydroxy-tetrahydrodipicolinate reductase [Bacteroidetes bacterium 4572_128]|nr:MAG: 4-hydroxy-tetrahydrodipicolinate reductase [Bacteroidetes bacterium 4572_128]